MKTVLFLAGLVTVALGNFEGSKPKAVIPENLKTTPIAAELQLRQARILLLLRHSSQFVTVGEYYETGQKYDIEANIDNYTNKKAVEEFLKFYKNRILPQGYIFSITNEKMREEAIALFHLFYYAKDFETFYKTAAWARSRVNEGMFVYSFSVAVLYRDDTQGMILPAPYEIYPFFFVNSDVIGKFYRIQMQKGVIDLDLAKYYGITFEDNTYFVQANYSGWDVYDNEEQKLSYFTEDIGLNSYYYYFHISMPFWMAGSELGPLKERRGEVFFYFHQQLLARYYMERLTNGLGEIPQLSWRLPIKTGYTPNLVNYNMHPFVTRNNYYHVEAHENVEDLEFLESYENQFIEFLEQGHFKAYNTEVDLRNAKSVNFVGNYWQSNADLYEKSGNRNYQKYYDIIARTVLGATTEPSNEYYDIPSALENFQTALRDPVFYQLYKRVMYYFLQYKQYLEPYTRENLNFVGVKINDVTVDELTTFYDFFEFDATSAAQYNQEQLKDMKYWFKVRQPRLNHKSFNVNIEVKSEVANDAIVKIFLAPKYDSQGHVISLEDNWNNFFELDSFKYKLTTGKNSIVRSSDEFTFFKQDSVSVFEIAELMDGGKVPLDMSQNYYKLPGRLMLPKGTKGGYPFQLFVMVYPYVAPTVDYEEYKTFILDDKPFGYPFDRPINELYFYQQNMYFKDVFINHEGEDNVYRFNVPGYSQIQNVVSKH